jgi:iron complex transport system substrate-binding protein
MADITAKAATLQPHPIVACLEWLDPLMAAGNWMPELVVMTGGVNCFGTAGKHSPTMRWEQLREVDPDVILALPCGLDLSRTRREMAAVTALPGWSDLRAVRSRRVYVTDGNQFFNRPGPRLVESLEILAEILHPQAFHFGHEGIGWERL